MVNIAIVNITELYDHMLYKPCISPLHIVITMVCGFILTKKPQTIVIYGYHGYNHSMLYWLGFITTLVILLGVLYRKPT